VSTGEDIKVFALRVPEMASKYNSKELVPALVRRILGFNRAKYSVDRRMEMRYKKDQPSCMSRG